MDYSKIPKIFRDPSAAMDGGNVHYSANPFLMPETTRTGLAGRRFTQSWKLVQVRPVYEIALIWDGVQCKHKNGDAEYASWTIDGQSLYFGGAAGYTRPTDAAARNPLVGQTIDAYTIAYPPAGDLRWRQLSNKACNLLFGDGHAETMRKGSVRKSNIWPIRQRG
jgi:prepilin-type processing-associated H-X9-DG protein